jgi:uncharacterized protein (TIGR01777 family)
VLSRNPAATRLRLPAGARMMAWDGKSARGWEAAADSAEAIINLASENLAGDGFWPTRWTEARKALIRQSRRETSAAVVAAVGASAHKPAVVIQASAIGYYGPRGDEALDETAGPGADFLADTAVEWEAGVRPLEDMGLRLVLARTGLILTPHGGPLARMAPFFRMGVGGPYGNGRQWWSWIHIRDEVRALRFLMEEERASGPYNLTAPNPTTNRDFARTLGRVLGRPAAIPVPAFALRLLLGEVAAVVLTGQRVLPHRLLQLGFRFELPVLEAALQELFA